MPLTVPQTHVVTSRSRLSISAILGMLVHGLNNCWPPTEQHWNTKLVGVATSTVNTFSATVNNQLVDVQCTNWVHWGYAPIYVVCFIPANRHISSLQHYYSLDEVGHTTKAKLKHIPRGSTSRWILVQVCYESPRTWIGDVRLNQKNQLSVWSKM